MQQGCFRHKVACSWCNSAVLGLLVLYGSEGTLSRDLLVSVLGASPKA